MTLSLDRTDQRDPLVPVRDGRLDLALVTAWQPVKDQTAVELIPLLDEELLLALPARHPLARHSSVRLRDETWIEGAHPDCLGPIPHLAGMLGDPPRIGFTCDDWNGKQALVTAGAGVTRTLARATVRADVALRATSRRHVAGHPPCHTPSGRPRRLAHHREPGVLRPAAATWDARFGDDIPAYAAAIAEAALPGGGTVADVGCGTGRALPALRDAVGPTGTVIGVDVTPQMLDTARARDRARHAVLLLADARRLPFADARLDAVFAAGLVEHMPDSDRCRRTRAGTWTPTTRPTGSSPCPPAADRGATRFRTLRSRPRTGRPCPAGTGRAGRTPWPGQAAEPCSERRSDSR